jgi:3-oxoacyl-[acyl-carrier protein] reductase
MPSPANLSMRGAGQHRDRGFAAKSQRSLHPLYGETIPLGRLGTPRDVAQAALFLASDEAA